MQLTKLALYKNVFSPRRKVGLISVWTVPSDDRETECIEMSAIWEIRQVQQRTTADCLKNREKAEIFSLVFVSPALANNLRDTIIAHYVAF